MANQFEERTKRENTGTHDDGLKSALPVSAKEFQLLAEVKKFREEYLAKRGAVK